MRTEPGAAQGSPNPGFVRKNKRPPHDHDGVDRPRERGKVDSVYLRALAARFRRLSQECFDLGIAGELRAIGEELDAKARQLDRATNNHGTIQHRLDQLVTDAREFVRGFWR